MEQIARVFRVYSDGTADVMRQQEENCAGDCRQCGGCGDRQQLLRVQNPIGARVGQQVRLQPLTSAVRKVAAALYLIPLVTFLAGYLLGEHLWGKGPLLCIVGFIVGMILVKAYDRHMTKKHTVYSITGFGPENTKKGDNEVD